jgi:VIT1/CCC1 family predicted Fe2+/Mn2+ transporter
MFDRLKYTDLPGALSDAYKDLADLVQGEIRLLKAELAGKISTKLGGFAWLAGGGILAIIAFVFCAQAAAFAIASLGLAMHWALLIVAFVIALVAGAAILKGLASAKEDMTPTRSLHQIRQDIHIAKERLS